MPAATIPNDLPNTPENRALKLIDSLPESSRGYVAARMLLPMIMANRSIDPSNNNGILLAERTIRALLSPQLQPPLPDHVRAGLVELEDQRSLSHNVYDWVTAVYLSEALRSEVTYGREEASVQQALFEQMGMDGAV